jgi:hypothetical protein
MPRVPLGDLHLALADPGRYRQRLDHPEPGFFAPSYFNALRDAVFVFHKPGGNVPAASSYLEERLDYFKNQRRSQQMTDQFDWYVTDFAQRDLVTFQTRLNVVLPLPAWAPPGLTCSGQISRVDMVLSGGYAAWMFRARDPAGWADQLQMPLAQWALATLVLGAPPSEVSMGLVSFEEGFVDSRIYSDEEIDKAHRRFEALLHAMGY